MTLKLDRSFCCKLALACITLSDSLERESLDPETNEDRKAIAKCSAEFWKGLHDLIRNQITEFDLKQQAKGEKK